MTDQGLTDRAHTAASHRMATPGLPKARSRKIANLPRELSDSGWFSMLGPVQAHPALSGRIDVDWAVVGGGWFGIHAARRMAELRPQDSIALLDAGMIGNNAAGRCAGYAIDLAHNPRNPNGEVHARKLILANNGWLSQFGFYENSAIPVYTYGSMTRPLTETESARIGGRATYGLIPADSFGTTVRRTADNRLFIRNIYDYCNGFHTSEAQIARSRESHQMSFDRRFPEISAMGFQYTWGGALSLAQNGGMVFGDLAEGVCGAGFCNGTGVSRGAIFGKALAEYACGQSSRAIDILLRRSRPGRAYPRPVTALGVTASTRYRLWKAGAEV